MKKTKELFVLFLILTISIIPFGYVNAHNVELDPKNLISYPIFAFNGSRNTYHF